MRALLTFIFIFQASINAKSATLKYSSSMSLYFSPIAHGYSKDTGYSPPQFADVDYNKMNFSCPGDSFIFHIESRYVRNTEPKTGRRLFRFACAFLEDSKKNLIKKTDCKTSDWNNTFSTKGESKCQKDEFIGGLQYEYDRKGDYLFKTECCKLSDKSGKVYQRKNCKAYQLNDKSEGGFEFLEIDKYKSNMLLQKIATEYKQDNNYVDRLYTVTSCKADL